MEQPYDLKLSHAYSGLSDDVWLQRVAVPASLSSWYCLTRVAGLTNHFISYHYYVSINSAGVIFVHEI